MRCNARNRYQVAFDVERQLRAMERGIDGEIRARCHEQRVAVGRGFCDEIDADDAVCARAVVNDNRLTERARENIPDHARDLVGAAACGKRQDDAYGFRWIACRGIFGLLGSAGGCSRNEECGQQQRCECGNHVHRQCELLAAMKSSVAFAHASGSVSAT